MVALKGNAYLLQFHNLALLWPYSVSKNVSVVLNQFSMYMDIPHICFQEF